MAMGRMARLSSRVSAEIAVPEPVAMLSQLMPEGQRSSAIALSSPITRATRAP
jgi:hypothetical protein